jgi:hypothetical protein
MHCEWKSKLRSHNTSYCLIQWLDFYIFILLTSIKHFVIISWPGQVSFCGRFPSVICPYIHTPHILIFFLQRRSAQLSWSFIGRKTWYWVFFFFKDLLSIKFSSQWRINLIWIKLDVLVLLVNTKMKGFLFLNSAIYNYIILPENPCNNVHVCFLLPFQSAKYSFRVISW